MHSNERLGDFLHKSIDASRVIHAIDVMRGIVIVYNAELPTRRKSVALTCRVGN